MSTSSQLNYASFFSLFKCWIPLMPNLNSPHTIPFLPSIQCKLNPKPSHASNMIRTNPQTQIIHQVTMSKEEGVRTVVVGGKKDIQQQYCGSSLFCYVRVYFDLILRHRHRGRRIFGFLHYGHRSQGEFILCYRFHCKMRPFVSSRIFRSFTEALFGISF